MTTSIGTISGAMIIKDQFSATFKKFGSGMGTVGKVTAVAGAAVAAFGAVAAASARQALQLSDALDNQSKATQTSVESLQVYNAAAERAGATSENVTTSLQRMQRSISEGSQQTEIAFDNLGISVDKLKQLKPDEQFELILKQLGNIPNEADRASAAMTIFGRSGANLLALSGDALPQLEERFRSLGLVVGEEVVASTDRLEENIDLLGRVVTGTFTNFGFALTQSEAFNEIIMLVTNVVGSFSSALQDNNSAISQWISAGLEFGKQALFGISLAVNEVIGFVSKLGAVFFAVGETVQSVLSGEGIGTALEGLESTFAVIDEKTNQTANSIEEQFVVAAQMASDQAEGLGSSVQLTADQMDALTESTVANAAATESAFDAWNIWALNLQESIMPMNEVFNQAFVDGLNFVTAEGINPFTTEVQLLGETIGGVADATENAFSRMGIKTRAQLQATAAQAEADYQTILASGQATADGIQQAWERMNEAQMALDEGTQKNAIALDQQLLSASGRVLGQLAGKSKAAAIAKATIDAFLAIQRTLATYPFPFNVGLAAAIGAIAFQNVAKIKAQSTGFRTGTPSLDFQDFGNETQTVLHGREAVIPQGGGHLLAREIAAAMPMGREQEQIQAPQETISAGQREPMIVNLNVDGRLLANWLEQGSKTGIFRIHPSAVEEEF